MFAYGGNNPIVVSDPDGYIGSLAFAIAEIGDQIIEKALEIGEKVIEALTLSGIIAGAAQAISSLLTGRNQEQQHIYQPFKRIAHPTDLVDYPTISYEVFQELGITIGSEWKNYEAVCWRAYRRGSIIHIKEPVNFEQARELVSNYESIFCVNKEAALAIVICNRYRNSVCDEAHQMGYFPHYHPTRNHNVYPSVHIWFLP